MYKIKWLDIGSIETPKNIAFYLGKSDERVLTNAFAFLLEDENGNIHIIDTGVRNPLEINQDKSEFNRWKVPESKTLTSQLSQMGIRTDEIKTVLLTHLHYDHCSQAPIFKNARIAISRKELISVIAPHDKDILKFTNYPRDIYSWFVGDGWRQVYLFENMQEVLPGIKAIVLGGHTPGSTAFVIEGERRDVIICGDFINRFENYEKRLPPGLLDSLSDWYIGMQKLEKIGGIIVPSHDPMLKEKYPSGIIGSK